MERTELAGINQTADVDLIHFWFPPRKGPFRLWRKGFNNVRRIPPFLTKF
jgi:hypothetical protein